MTIQTIDTVTPEIGLKGAAEKINANFTNAAHAASYEVGTDSGQIPRNSDLPTLGTAAQADTGTASGDVPTNANLSAAVCGTSSFSGDVYTFTPSGSGFRPLQAGMYLSFKLPSGSANTTTTPDIDYNGATYVIKWIDGSALVADDLNETYNKQPILFYFDGTDMLIASDISGSNSNGVWIKFSSGEMRCNHRNGSTITTSLAFGSVFADSGTIFTFPKVFLSNPYIATFAEEVGGNVVWGGDVRNNSTTSALIVVYGATNTQVGTPGYTAIGRWY